MGYTAQWVNKTAVPGGASATLILTDPQGRYPDIRQEMKFRGMTPVDLTNAFLRPFRRRAEAQAIQDYWVAQAEERLQRIRDRYIARRLAQLASDMQDDWITEQVQPANIVGRITQAWASENLAGVISTPTVTISGTNVQASN